MADEATGGLPAGEANGDRQIITTPEGFKIHGQNETSLIRSLNSLNVIPVADIEEKARQGGLLEHDKSLIDAMANANDSALEIGFTHQQLADFLSQFANEPRDGELKKIDGGNFAYKCREFRTLQQSPFNNREIPKSVHTIINLETGAKIEYSGLLPEMIHSHGFYAGLDPKSIAELAGFIPPSPDDPVVQLVQNQDASVEITTEEQLDRINNLSAASIDVLSGQNYRIVPEDIEVLLALSESFTRPAGIEESEEQRIRRARIATDVDTQRLIPQPYLMEKNNNTVLTKILPKDFPQFEQVVLDNIDHILLPPGDDDSSKLAVKEFLEEALKGASEKIDGQDSPHKAYYEGLLQKLPQDPHAALQIYDAAAQISYGHPEAIVTLDHIMPTLKTDVIAFYAQLGMPSRDDMTLEQLTQEQGEMLRYKQTLNAAIQSARNGGVVDIQNADMGKLFGMIYAVDANPAHQYTPDEDEALTRLTIDPSLIPYAFEITAGFVSRSPELIIAQLFNGAAQRKRDGS